MTWHFSKESLQNGERNMQADREILGAAGEGIPSCRVYGWDGAWISLGTSQRAERDLLDPRLIPHVMRPTGGKAVLHGHDVTVGLAVPLKLLALNGESTDKLSRSVKAVYRRLILPIVEAMKECGLPAALAEETQFVGKGPKTADCFAHISPNDVVDSRTGVKVCGCALKLTAKAVLLQASLPAGEPLVDPARLFEKPQQMHTREWDHGGFARALQNHLDRLYPAG